MRADSEARIATIITFSTRNNAATPSADGRHHPIRSPPRPSLILSDIPSCCGGRSCHCQPAKLLLSQVAPVEAYCSVLLSSRPHIRRCFLPFDLCHNHHYTTINHCHPPPPSLTHPSLVFRPRSIEQSRVYCRGGLSSHQCHHQMDDHQDPCDLPLLA